ncbi:MAG: cryptochrome/photolyase family protein, partial [Solirubrobacterales bacterium]
RLADHAALALALTDCRRVYCAFIFDRAILDELIADGHTADRRVEFIHGAVTELDQTLRSLGSMLVVRHADAATAIPRLAKELAVDAVFATHDVEPAAIARDAAVARALAADGRTWVSCKDQVIFEKSEVKTAAGKPFAVFTPYKNAWLRQLAAVDFATRDTLTHRDRLATAAEQHPLPSLEELGFARTNLSELAINLGESGAHATFEDFAQRIDGYADARNFPAIRGPSYLSIHLRFGTISIRELVRFAAGRPDSPGAQTWLSELIWREFYQMILWHHPHVVGHAWRPEYDGIEWESGAPADENFAAWCEGRTGFPLVDAAMAQLNSTGYMHNRLRMVTASFLTKDLGIDWRRGEHYFARQLNDFDLASNNGGWQWAASTGCDAQPYFRIFNPVTQSQKFDPDGQFIKRYLPQLTRLDSREIHAPWLMSAERQRAAACMIGRDYPAPIVDHAEARAKTLARYAAVRVGPRGGSDETS